MEHLKALQAASQTWQRSMMYASKRWVAWQGRWHGLALRDTRKHGAHRALPDTIAGVVFQCCICSHQELMEQIESTTQELGSVSERLRSVEAQRIAAVRDAETLRARVTHLEGLAADLQAGLKQK